MLDSQRLSETLTLRHGIALDGDARDDELGQHARVWPRDLSTTRGFIVEVVVGWRSVTTTVSPGNYASKLLAALSQSTAERRATFGVFIKAAASDGAAVTFKINDAAVDPFQPAGWPAQWQGFTILALAGPLEIDSRDPTALAELTAKWGGRMLCSVLALLELETALSNGEAEGGQWHALVTRYERSEVNRAACIELFGPRCAVCGFDFETHYGEIGRGFIEVHHKEMVSRLEPGTVLDPATDLVPLCANCHRMSHRRSFPFTVEELKAFLRSDEERP